MKRFLCVFAALAFLVITGNAYATSLDYSDAMGYGVASAQDATWNRLGTTWTAESGPKFDNNDTDDGVLWSINGGAYGHADIIIGDTVTFKFILSKVEWGRHYADFLKVWVDWNNDKDFTEKGEMIYQDAYEFKSHYEADHSLTQFLNKDKSPKIVEEFEYTMLFNDILAGDYWLRARVVCNADAGSLDRVSSIGSYYQGEIEDWKLTVKNRTVPEPSAMILLGVGMVGLASLKRKFKKS